MKNLTKFKIISIIIFCFLIISLSANYYFLNKKDNAVKIEPFEFPAYFDSIAKKNDTIRIKTKEIVYNYRTISDTIKKTEFVFLSDSTVDALYLYCCEKDKIIDSLFSQCFLAKQINDSNKQLLIISNMLSQKLQATNDSLKKRRLLRDAKIFSSGYVAGLASGKLL